jgi:small-conductance mechanosensitive channel
MKSLIPAISRYLLRVLLLLLLFYLKSLVIRYQKDLDFAFPVVRSILQFAIFFVTINLITAALIVIYRLRKNIPFKYTDNVIVGINNVYYLILTIGVGMMILGFWGINVKELFTSLSIFAAAIAIIAKDFVSTIISGIILSFSNDINIDDYVKIGEHKGKIVDINIQKIVILNDDDDIIYLPNDKVLQSEIINYTKREIKKVNIDFEMSTQSFSSVEEIERQLADSLSEFSHWIEKGSYNIKIVDVKYDRLFLKFQYALTEVNRDIERTIRKKTIRLIANMVGNA